MIWSAFIGEMDEKRRKMNNMIKEELKMEKKKYQNGKIVSIVAVILVLIAVVLLIISKGI